MPALHRYSTQISLPSQAANTEAHAIRLQAPPGRAVRLTEVRLNAPNLTGLANAPRLRFMLGDARLANGATPEDGSAAVPAAAGMARASAIVCRGMAGTPNGSYIGGSDITASTAGATSTHVLVEATAPAASAGQALDVILSTQGSALTTPTVTVFWEE
ncbi:MAG: hypothetical protein ACK5HM_08310 [Gemmatimonas sp.]|jgi:hypothetical protein|uniref:hypothetical protein n=2 Tax=Gemmatimonas sp. TaxID=1962908 RepID=UPI0022C48977|nr:hypothetical protein [Gemmatimonas sp.]MCZ8012022.1 hypothetical protein [Gemmatimonas sp.]MCZ8267342.1 hypothetical protein [Gemmatimonas sp.]